MKGVGCQKKVGASHICCRKLVTFVGLDQVLELDNVPFLVGAVWIAEGWWQSVLEKSLACDLSSQTDDDIECSLPKNVEEGEVVNYWLVFIDPAFHFGVICIGKRHAKACDCDAGFISEANLNDCEALFASLGVGKPIKNGLRGFSESVAACFAREPNKDAILVGWEYRTTAYAWNDCNYMLVSCICCHPRVNSQV